MTILIAEDDPLTLEALATCCENEGFKTLRASDGREAVKLWRESKPDLLCLDIMMPHVDGYEVCRRVRASDRTVPILFLSAKNQEVDVVVGLDLGADDFIRKPFTRREVMARVSISPRARFRSCGCFTTTMAKLSAATPSSIPAGALIISLIRERLTNTSCC